jgi:hypothetical protein
MPKKIVS